MGCECVNGSINHSGGVILRIVPDNNKATPVFFRVVLSSCAIRLYLSETGMKGYR